MSIIRVPSTKDTPEDVASLKKTVDDIPPAVNLSVEAVRKALDELQGTVVKKSGAVMDGGLIAPVVVVGTDPGSTESLRTDSSRMKRAVVGTTPPIGTESLCVDSSKMTSIVVGTSPPDGTENLRVDSSRATNLTVESSLVVGANPPGGTESLRADTSRTTSLIVGNNPPGGSENLRVDSSRMSSATVGADPPAGSEKLKVDSSRMRKLYVVGSPPDSPYLFASDLYIVFRVDNPDTSQQFVVKQVFIGPPDSGGPGYRVLRVLN